MALEFGAVPQNTPFWKEISSGRKVEYTKYDLYGIIIAALLMILLVSPYIQNSYWTDEIFSVVSSGSISGLVEMFSKNENNMALYYLMLHYWIQLFGDSELSARSLSLLFAIVTIPVFHFTVKKYYGTRAAFSADLLLISNPVFLYFAIEARGYSLLTLMSALATFLFLVFYERPSYKVTFYYSVVVALAVYSHYFGVFVPFCHIIYLIFKGWNKNHLRKMILASIIVSVSTSPLLIFHPSTTGQINWISKPDSLYIVTILSRLSGSKVIFLFNVVACFCIAANFLRKKNSVHIRDLSLFPMALIIFILPVTIVYIVSVLVTPVMLLRYFSWCVPSAIIISFMVIRFAGVKPWLRTGLVMLFFAFQLFQVFPELRVKDSGSRDLTLYLKDAYHEGDALICYPYLKSSHIIFYSSKLSSRMRTIVPMQYSTAQYNPGGGGRDPDPDMKKVVEIAGNHKRVFVVCRNSTEEMDVQQNRTWLPAITDSILKYHRRKKEMVFMREADEPVRLLIFE